MSYELYQTEGLIIKSGKIGEADKIFSVFTKDFGRIELAAKGTRLLKSKLRPHLNLLDYSRFAFVSGKEFWRLVDAEKINSWQGIGADKNKTETFAKISRLLEKMLQGEERNEKLWETVKSAAVFLDENELNKEEIKIFENIILLRALYLLGYVDNSGGVSKELTDGDFNFTFLKKYGSILPQIKKIIEKAVTASHL